MIWSYWEQGLDAAPPWLRLRHATVHAHAGGHEVVVLDRASVPRYLPQLPEGIDSLPHIASRADILRTRLLERYGGLWLDLDMIACPALASVFDLLGEHEFVSTGTHSDDVTMSFMACRPGAALVAEWAELQASLLTDSPDLTTTWGAFGGPLVREPARRIGFFDVGAARVVPIGWREWRRFDSPFGDHRRPLAADPFVIHLFNQEMAGSWAQRSEEEVLHARRLLSRLLRHSLGVPAPPGDDLLTRLQPIESAYRWSIIRARALRRRFTQ